MKRILPLLFVFLFYTGYAAVAQEKDTLENMLIITCHPDDWELGMAGTAYMLKDKFQIHVIIASDGELGNTWNTTGKPDPDVAKLRVEHSNKSAEKIHAITHFFKMEDGGVYANENAVKRTTTLLEDIDPEIVFLHWPIDKPDHVAASAMALMALSSAGMKWDREIYFFEVGQLDYFTPEIYVDITSVWDNKKELVHIHERFGDDRFKEMAERSAVHHGKASSNKYAEVFKPLIPFSNSEFWDQMDSSLLDL